MLFFFNNTATTKIYTLSLHSALPISGVDAVAQAALVARPVVEDVPEVPAAALADDFGADHAIGAVLTDLDGVDRKSTRLNSSHANISYAVFCLKKKK